MDVVVPLLMRGATEPSMVAPRVSEGTDAPIPKSRAPTPEPAPATTPDVVPAPSTIPEDSSNRDRPVAPTLADAEAIALEAERSTHTVGLYMSYFDQPLIHDLRDMVTEGWLGDIVHCYARLMHQIGRAHV